MSKSSLWSVTLIVALGIPLIATHTALAATTGDVSSVDNFIRSVIKIAAGLAGLIATGFFVVGGFIYITSSGKPANLERGKRTLTYSSIGLVIVIAAFVISNIVTTVATNAFGS